jgi:hypothetical protein
MCKHIDVSMSPKVRRPRRKPAARLAELLRELDDGPDER